MDRHQISLGLLILRVVGGALLISGRAWSWQSLIDSNRVLESTGWILGGEINWFLTLLSECLCTLLVMLGIFTKFTSVPPAVAMIVAGLALPGGTAWSVREFYFLLALPFFVLSFTGPGEYSMDNRLAALSGSR
jgi:putative oxidoreductase